MWNDGRTQSIVEELSKGPKGKSALVDVCGLPLSTYFSAVKIRWILDHHPEIRKLALESLCKFGTVDSWLVWVQNFSHLLLMPLLISATFAV